MFPLNDFVSNAQWLFVVQCHVQLNCWSRGTNREIALQNSAHQSTCTTRSCDFCFWIIFPFQYILCFMSNAISDITFGQIYSEISQSKLNAYRAKTEYCFTDISAYVSPIMKSMPFSFQIYCYHHRTEKYHCFFHFKTASIFHHVHGFCPHFQFRLNETFSRNIH